MAIEIINGLYLGSKIDSHNPIFLSSRKIKVIINTTTEIPFLKDCENLGIQCIRVPISNDYEKQNKILEMKEEIQMDEVITKSTPTGEVIHDFVHSENPKFAGKSKKERIRMALGAKYAMMRGKK